MIINAIYQSKDDVYLHKKYFIYEFIIILFYKKKIQIFVFCFFIFKLSKKFYEKINYYNKKEIEININLNQIMKLSKEENNQKKIVRIINQKMFYISW